MIKARTSCKQRSIRGPRIHTAHLLKDLLLVPIYEARAWRAWEKPHRRSPIAIEKPHGTVYPIDQKCDHKRGNKKEKQAHPSVIGWW
jgi:hypothetical protein